jgi:hypothetical protein
MNFTSVGFFSNNTDKEITIYLEMHCEEIRVSPDQSFELLIEDIHDALPVTINYVESGLQIYPHRATPDWLIIFNGQRIKPSYPTILKNYE